MSRPSIPALLAALVLTAIACQEADLDPLRERLLSIADSQAADVLQELLQAYGGYDNWAQRRNVQYTYQLAVYGEEEEPSVVSRQTHRLGLGSRAQVYIEDLDTEMPQVVRLDGDHLEVTRGGDPVRDPDDLGFPEAYGRIVRWTFRSPWHLLDGRSRLTFRGVRTPRTTGPVPTGACDVVRLQIEEEGPWGTTDDWHDFYISRRSHLVEQIHSYRAADGSFRVSIWSDHRSFDGVRVAARRRTYASDVTGAIGPLVAVAEYSDVQFDAPFGDDLFSGTVPLAASSAPGSQ